MYNLSKALSDLRQDQKDLLSYAFENGITEYVTIANKWIIGVNLEGNPNVLILETKGLWSFGEKKNAGRS